MSNLPLRIAKFLVGFAFIFFGMDGFLHFLPHQPIDGEHAKAFLGALDGSGFLKVVKALEILGGILVISGRLAPLGLVILGPIQVSILLFDVTMFTAGLPVILILGALTIFIGFKHREFFTPFFKPHSEHCTFHPTKPPLA